MWHNFLRKRQIPRRPQFPSIAPRITTHEDERIRIAGDASQGADVSDGVARGVEEVERAVGEVLSRARRVPRRKGGGEAEFDELAVGEVAGEDGA